MRKLLLITLMCCIMTNLYAQLRVLDNGRVEIGTVPQYPDYPEANKDTITMCKIFGPYGSLKSGGHISFGDQLSKYVWNVVVGELGYEDTDQLWLQGKLGTYLTCGLNPDTICYYDPAKGNFFKFNCDVHTSGVFVFSDSLFKENITPLNHSLSDLSKLTAVSYKLKSTVNNSLSMASRSMSSGGKTDKDQRDEAIFSQLREKQKKEPARFGFIAQDVKDIYPQLVHTDTSGYMYVDYVGMIPLLVNALTELKGQIDVQETVITTLKDKITDLENGSSALQTASDLNGMKDIIPALYQNTPNPFSVSTKISYALPHDIRQADIYIYDMQGQQIRKIEITDRGESSITIQGSELSAGMYIYSLIADNREIDSKRMILTQ